jgi:hypothetical protein
MSWLNDAQQFEREKRNEDAKARHDGIQEARRKHAFAQQWEGAITRDLRAVGRILWGSNLWERLTMTTRFVLEPRYNSWIKHIKGWNYHEGYWEIYSSIYTRGTRIGVWIDFEIPCFGVSASTGSEIGVYAHRTTSCDHAELQKALSEATQVILQLEPHYRT